MGMLQRSVPTLFLSLLLAACSAGSSSSSPPEPASSTAAGGGEVASWSRPADPMSLVQAAGLTPDVKEYFDYHVHAHLDVFVDGEPVEIRVGSASRPRIPPCRASRTGSGGTPETGCEQACISPLHTHDVDGVIHIEAPSDAEFTLGQFFEQLAVRLDATCVDEYCMPDTPVAVYVDGEPRSGDPDDIVLADGQEIAIVIGTPPDEIPGLVRRLLRDRARRGVRRSDDDRWPRCPAERTRACVVGPLWV